MTLTDKLKRFINKSEDQTDDLEENQIIKPKNGLVERVDKVLKTSDGRQLLREQLYEQTSNID